MNLLVVPGKNSLIIFEPYHSYHMQWLFNMKWDVTVLKYINSQWHHPFLDWLLPFLRNADMWIPLYLFIVLFVLMNYKKTGWWWVLAAAATPVITDLISSHFIKENIFRLRPCNDPELAGWLRIFPGIYQPQSSSFTSSHAANHFGVAMFIVTTLRKETGKWISLFFLWAAAICYAQMYVGVHYPFDILCGAAVGVIVGYSTATVFNRNKVLA